MNRFAWLVRREIWEHKAIWVAPLVVLGCLLVLVVTGNVHLGPIVDVGDAEPFSRFPRETQFQLLLIVYAGLALVVDMVMGIVAFFYALDSLYADRRDRSVLFWKSLPLSDAETVLSKFAVATAVIPLVTLAAAVLAQLLVATGGSAKLALAGLPAGIMWHPEAILGGALVAVVWCFAAMLWYAPVLAYLMLASAWAPKGPFLWAVLPPVTLIVLERILLYTSYVEDFVTERLFGLYRLLRPSATEEELAAAAERSAGDAVAKLSEVDILGSLASFFTSADLWLGLVAAGLLLSGAVWVRRYRDETA